MRHAILILGLGACAAAPTSPPPRFDSGSDARVDSGRVDSGSDAATIDAAGVDAAVDTGVDAPPACIPTGSCDPLQMRPCPDGQSCRPDSEGSFRCAVIEPAPFALGQACTTAASCDRGLLCLNFGDGLKCHGLCPADSAGQCPTDQACSGSLGTDCVQVCRDAAPLCDIYAQDCANAADGCIPTFDPETDAPVTACRTAGPSTLGQPCGSVATRCQEGLVCVRSGGVDTCRELCMSETCSTGSCVGMLSMWGITYCSSV